MGEKVERIEPRFELDEPVTTPAGRGRIAALSRTVNGWIYRVALHEGGHWTGPESALSAVESKKS